MCVGIDRDIKLILLMQIILYQLFGTLLALADSLPSATGGLNTRKTQNNTKLSGGMCMAWTATLKRLIL